MIMIIIMIIIIIITSETRMQLSYFFFRRLHIHCIDLFFFLVWLTKSMENLSGMFL